jgi:hypothetical protein
VAARDQPALEDQLAAYSALHRADFVCFARLDAALRAAVGMTFFERELLSILDSVGGTVRKGVLARELMVLAQYRAGRPACGC